MDDISDRASLFESGPAAITRIGPVRVSKNGPTSRIGTTPGCCCVSWCEASIWRSRSAGICGVGYSISIRVESLAFTAYLPITTSAPDLKSTIEVGRGDPTQRDRTQNVLRLVLLQILLGTSVRTTGKSPLRKVRGQRRRLVLAARSLRQQPSQLPQLRRRHHTHSVEHRIHQCIPLIEQHAVIQKSR